MKPDHNRRAMTRPAILIVDDEKGVQTSVQGILEDVGFDSQSVSSGEEALELAAEEGISRRAAGHLAARNGWPAGPRQDPADLSGDQCHHDFGPWFDRDRGTGNQTGRLRFCRKAAFAGKNPSGVKNALHQHQLQEENRLLRKQIEQKYVMIGDSVPMQALRQQIAFAAPTNGRVLIYGENGTGKELVAHLLHLHSQRRDAPFIEMNCAAIPEELIESELFGHVKGSFTGASEDKEGKFAQADGGTLFLDEVGDMSSKDPGQGAAGAGRAALHAGRGKLRRSRWMCGSSLRPTKTWNGKSNWEISARIFITG